MRWLRIVCAAPLVLLTACESTPTPRLSAHRYAPTTTDEIPFVGESDPNSRPLRSAPPEFDDADPSAISLFHGVLASYGTWSEDDRLGLVWSPSHESVGDEFVPYATHGRWTHRAWNAGGGEPPIDEYVWVSELPWGWVTFHYGRWTYAGDRGWSWIPGRRYAGAWVDWRIPDNGNDPRAVVGWGPTPPSELWRRSPGAGFVAVPYNAFATPYAYARTRDLFAPNVGERLLYGPAALAVADATQPGPPPRLEQIGMKRARVPAPPTLDRGLQQAWMLATPSMAAAVGQGPELPGPPHLKTYVTGGPRYATW